jgi:hypothetical protein
MNVFYGLGLYVTVQAHFKQPLNFPGDLTAWELEHSHPSAYLTGYQSEHAVLEENMRDQVLKLSMVLLCLLRARCTADQVDYPVRQGYRVLRTLLVSLVRT